MKGSKKDNDVPLLIDRIQLSISTRYLVTKDKNEKWIEENCDKIMYYTSIFGLYFKEKRKNNIFYDKKKNQYYIQVSEELYKTEYPFVSHIRLRMDNPYTVTVEFNFIRLLREFIIAGGEYDYDYDISIRVAEDNYINRKIWCGNWDNFLIRSLSENIKNLACTIAEFVIKKYIEDFDEKYCTVTIKQIEFCKDYFVGHHKSSDIHHDLMYYVISASGVEWVNKLSGISTRIYKAAKSKEEANDFYGDPYNPTMKFKIGRGFFCNIYRKTTDHIRFELTLSKEYIKQKFGRENIDDIYEGLRDIAKSFMKKSDFKEVLNCSIDNNYSDSFPLVSNTFDFLDKTYPEISSIMDSVIHKNPISNDEIIGFINGNKRVRKYFQRVYLGNGKKVLIYKDIISEVKKKHNIRYNVDDRNEFIEGLWKDYKESYPEDKIYVKNELNGFIHKGN